MFMDTTRHNNRALSTLVDNLSELIDKNINLKIKEVRGKK